MSEDDLRRARAWGLFTIEKEYVLNEGRELFVIECLGVRLALGPFDTERKARDEFDVLVARACELDGNYQALAIAWAHASAAQANLTSVQKQCTELIQEARAYKAKLKLVRDEVYAMKFAVEQGSSPNSVHERLVEILDDAASKP